MTPIPPAPIDRFLRPGEFAVCDGRYRLRTLLGSCVSITLWHPRKHIGAMSHFLLPARGRSRAGDVLDGRYGEDALDLMLRQLERRHVAGGDCVARIFGGGNMFPHCTVGGASGDVGRRNGEAARALLQGHGISVHSESLFGVGHRRIDFLVATGEVRSEQVSLSESRRTTAPGTLVSTPGSL